MPAVTAPAQTEADGAMRRLQADPDATTPEDPGFSPADGKPDQINVEIAVNTADTIRSVIVVQEVIYTLSDQIAANIRQHFYNQFDTPHGFESLTVQGEIQLH